MLNREEIFEICLEDYTQPRYKSAIRTYYGTEDEIHDLMDRLTNSATGAAVRYNETIEAVEYYDLDNELTHTVAGQTLPVLKPVEELCRYEGQLSEKYWNYTTYDGVTIPCYASKLDICQCLIATDSGYERCVKADVTGFYIYHHGLGWVSPFQKIKGFPGMVLIDGEKATVTLYASQRHYEPDELEEAKADTVNMDQIRLSVIVADILGEG